MFYFIVDRLRCSFSYEGYFFFFSFFLSFLACSRRREVLYYPLVHCDPVTTISICNAVDAIWCDPSVYEPQGLQFSTIFRHRAPSLGSRLKKNSFRISGVSPWVPWVWHEPWALSVTFRRSRLFTIINHIPECFVTSDRSGMRRFFKKSKSGSNEYWSDISLSPKNTRLSRLAYQCSNYRK